jgi:MarR family transcriptional regulator for hemolysin
MSLPSYTSSILLTKAYRIIRTTAYDCLDKHGINATQWSILGLVHEAKNGITLSVVADNLGVKKPLITLLVDGMVERDMVERKPNKDDSRSKLLFMKPNGKKLIKTMETEIQNGFQPLFDGVSDHSFSVYTSVLEAIIKNEGLKNAAS